MKKRVSHQVSSQLDTAIMDYTNTITLLKHLDNVILEGIDKQLDLQSLIRFCEQKLQITPIRFDASHVEMVALKHGKKWRFAR
jgi:hypothetical protein